MGHGTVKRVPLDFDWPANKVWQGYLTPDDLTGPDCPDCDGNGETPTGQWIRALSRLLLLLGDDVRAQRRGGGSLHRELARIEPALDQSFSRLEMRPGPDAVEFSAGLAGGRPRGVGHSPLDTWVAEKAIIKAAGLPEDWAKCPTCRGHRWLESYPGQRAEYDTWEPTEPPTGEGWQLWNSGGSSPVSPVFESAETLADWCAGRATWFGKRSATREEWLRSFLAGTP